MPVAENIVYLKFTYDLYNDTTNTPAVNQPNPGSGDANDSASNGLYPNQITKINILNMAMDSTLHGASAAIRDSNGFADIGQRAESDLHQQLSQLAAVMEMAKGSKTMGNKTMGNDTMGSYSMKSARLHTKGFTLIASLLMLLLLSGIAIGLMMMVNTEGKVGGTDLQNNMAFHARRGWHRENGLRPGLGVPERAVPHRRSNLRRGRTRRRLGHQRAGDGGSHLDGVFGDSAGTAGDDLPDPAQLTSSVAETWGQRRPDRTRVCGRRSSRSTCWRRRPFRAGRK